MKHKVSVIIPTHNEEKNIIKCIRSINNQYYKPYEVIVVDYESTDRTIERAIHHCKLPLRIIKVHRPGIGYARMLGVKHAKGDIIWSADADAIYPYNFLRKAIETMEFTKAVMVYGNGIPKNHVPVWCHILEQTPVAKGYAMVIKKEHADFRDEQYEDTMLMYRLLMRFKTIVYNPFLICYIRSPTTGVRDAIKTVEGMIKVWNSMYNSLIMQIIPKQHEKEPSILVTQK